MNGSSPQIQLRLHLMQRCSKSHLPPHHVPCVCRCHEAEALDIGPPPLQPHTQPYVQRDALRGTAQTALQDKATAKKQLEAYGSHIKLARW